MGGPMPTPAPTPLPTAVPTPYIPTELTYSPLIPAWLIWLLIVAAIGIMAGLAFVPAGIAKKKGYSYGGFWVFGFFLFIPAIIVVAAMKERASQPVQLSYTQPFAQAPQPPASLAQPPGTCYCTHCGALMPEDSAFCPTCGAHVG